MTLAFPNRSRSFDPTHNRVRFSGYDGMFQVQYFLEADALAAAGNTEAGILAAFDAQWEKIARVATRSYSSSRRATYVLTRADF